MSISSASSTTSSSSSNVRAINYPHSFHPNLYVHFSLVSPPLQNLVEPPLKGFQILLIICGILFLSLLLLGLGCSYYCLRRRNMTVVRQPFSSIGTDSEITKLSGSSLGNTTFLNSASADVNNNVSCDFQETSRSSTVSKYRECKLPLFLGALQEVKALL